MAISAMITSGVMMDRRWKVALCGVASFMMADAANAEPLPPRHSDIHTITQQVAPHRRVQQPIGLPWAERQSTAHHHFSRAPAAFVTGIGLQIRALRRRTAKCRKASDHIAKLGRAAKKRVCVDTLVKQCLREKWTTKQLACVRRSKTLAASNACRPIARKPPATSAQHR